MALLQDFESFNQNNFSSARETSAPSVEHLINEIGAEREEEKETPMFDMGPVRCPPVTSEGLVDMVVCNNIICIALGNMHIVRLNLAQPDVLTTIPVTQHQQNEQIHKIFMDPSGSHVIVSMTTANNWYLHGTWKKKLYYLKDMKGIVVESVGWDKKNGDIETTRQILIGSNTGTIFETKIDIPSAQIGKCKQKLFRPVYNMGEDMKITGLEFERFPAMPSEPPKFLILATTPTRFYQFIGGPTFLSVFENYVINPGFRELLGDRKDSVFRLYTSKPTGLAESFAWLTGPGISHGEMLFESQRPGDSVTQNMELLLFPDDPIQKNLKYNTAPVSLVVTQFHWLVLYNDKIQAINKLNEQTTWEERFRADQQLGEVRGITRDPITQTIWVYAQKQIFEIDVTDEDRNIWKLFLDKKLYSKALEFCKTPKQHDIVWSAQADHYFEQGNYLDAATYYGKTAISFEEISLRFIRMDNRDALKTYLLQKLENLDPKDVTQRTLLCTWLVEIYLDKLNRLTNDRDRSTLELLQVEFKKFMAYNKESLESCKATIYNLITSHGRVDELLYFATQVGDLELVITHYIQRREWHNALEVLQSPYQKSEELFYNFLPVLMKQIPSETVNELLKAGNTLNARKLIPALMRYEPSGATEHQAIRYLQYAIDVLGNTDPTVHNFLISLYARTSRYHDALLKFLSTDNPMYDREYALRTCMKENQVEACVLIYSAMGEYEEAVELSLKIDIDLAKDQVQRVHNDDERRKKLWLRIARHVVEKEENIKEAMAFLSQADNLLKIEDILPFFPQFTLIDDFKEEICNALKEYSERIEELKTEMDEATRSAVLIRRDIKNLRNKYGFVSQNQMCDICGYPVLTRLFYLFPCLHVYHGDCLTKEVMNHLGEQKKQRILFLEQEIANHVPSKTLMDTVREGDANMVAGMSEVEQNKAELDELIAAECLLCGDVMIESVQLPFFDPSDRELLSGWTL